MNEYDLQIYVNALFVLMISSIAAFLFIIRKIDTDEISAKSLSYYNLYFIIGIIGWLGLWAKDSLGIDTDLTVSVIFYILASLLLLLAIVECTEKKIYTKTVFWLHAAIIAGSLQVDNDASRILVIAAYSLLIYPVIFYLSYQRARIKHNIGNAITSVAALLVILVAPFQIYGILTAQDPNLAYGISLISSSTGFILVGIGFLTSIMFIENGKLKQLALHDPLTRLYNRRGMEIALITTLANTQRSGNCISAITIDIDHFKNINDTYGHDGGDFVLQKIAGALLLYSRSGDICCRLGGEEFVIVLPDTETDNASKIAERIRAHIENLKLSYNDRSISLTASFGIASHCENIDIDYLLKDADKALYKAKEEGRNRICINTSERQLISH